MDFTSSFLSCMRAFGSVISDIVAILSGIYLFGDISLWHFSIGLSMTSLTIILLKGVFGSDSGGK